MLSRFLTKIKLATSIDFPADFVPEPLGRKPESVQLSCDRDFKLCSSCGIEMRNGLGNLRSKVLRLLFRNLDIQIPGSRTLYISTGDFHQCNHSGFFNSVICQR